jgi:hypothetical protein
VPKLNDRKVGYIGHYYARDPWSGVAILEVALAELQKQGCELAIGPIDGNTWRNYRFITGKGKSPRFFLEQDHPLEWPYFFRKVGFYVCASYTSACTTNLLRRDTKAQEVGDRLAKAGCTVRTFNKQNVEGELQAIYQLSQEAFKNNFLFTPISYKEFSDKYTRLLPLLNEDLVLMLMDGEDLVGYSFAIPDHNAKTPQLISKTLARKLIDKYSGAGRFMLDELHRRASQLGFTNVIHAYMKSDNSSLKLSNGSARTIREYSLFAKSI